MAERKTFVVVVVVVEARKKHAARTQGKVTFYMHRQVGTRRQLH